MKEVKSSGKSIILKETPKHKSQNQFTELYKITRKLKKDDFNDEVDGEAALTKHFRKKLK